MVRIQKRGIVTIVTIAMFSLALIWGTNRLLAADNEIDSAIESFANNIPNNFEMFDIEDGYIIASWTYSNTFHTDSSAGNYDNPYINITGFELLVAEDKDYTVGLTSYTVDIGTLSNSWEKPGQYKAQVPVSILGENGKALYAKVRVVGSLKTITERSSGEIISGHNIGEAVCSNYLDLTCWARTTNYSNDIYEMERNYCEFWKINKKNFPGLYKLLKDGYSEVQDGKKIRYDKNQDGWLTPNEIQEISSIDNYIYEKYKKTGEYYRIYTWEKSQCKVSSLKGVEKLPFAMTIDVRSYTGSKVDLTEAPWVNDVDIREIYSKKIVVNAPKARVLTIISECGGSWGDAKVEKIDLSQCKDVVRLCSYGSYFKEASIILPKKAKNLKSLAYGYTKGKTINLNSYSKLMVAQFYATPLTSVKMDKCKDLRYLYFYCCDDISSVNVSKAKKLAGCDVCYCKRLSPSSVKTVSGVKKTKNTGRWWEATKKYKKIEDSISDSIHVSSGIDW